MKGKGEAKVKAKGKGEAQGKGKDKGKGQGKVQCKGKAQGKGQVTGAPKLLFDQEKTRKREYSRIYHSTCDSAIKKGWATQQAKARAREAAKQHVASHSFSGHCDLVVSG